LIVTIIIPLYNRANLIGYTLDSIAEQNCNGIELETIVVDDGSSDEGYERVQKQYPWVKLYKQQNQGAPTARNLGLKNASGEFILFLDSDDLIEPNYFVSKVIAFENDQNIDAVYGSWDHFTSSTSFKEKDSVKRHTNYPMENLPNQQKILSNILGGWYIPINATLWRKKVLQDLGGFNSSLPINQDVDLMFRFLIQDYKIIGKEGSRALIRDHDNERVGSLNTKNKMESLFQLRKDMRKTLMENQLWKDEFSQNLGTYMFNFWKNTRKVHPPLAKKALSCSKELFPNYKTPGGGFHKVIQAIFGNKNTIIIKSFMGR
jgi:glycosyltransferase involved in cell wall biosynthesis